MILRSPRRTLVLGAATALALAIGLPTAGATPAAPGLTASTPAPIATPDGTLMSYLVNARIANPGQTRLVERAVQQAGGVVVQSWPQIGVVVAHSTNGSFRQDVLASGNAVESVGATRSVTVSEGTPEQAGASWGRGASGTARTRRRRPTATCPPRKRRPRRATLARASSGTWR